VQLSRQLVEHVANLAQIRLTEDEAEQMTRELGKVLDYVSILDGVSTEGVEATRKPTVFREANRVDEVAPSLAQFEALANAPAAQDGMFVIPRILSEGEDR
jgi:aspartyl-tRNA(Asn)/glutamyl-tRNA(Gln) amidotransferase subunit C